MLHAVGSDQLRLLGSSFQVIPRWRLQEIQCLRGVKLCEFPLGDLGQCPESTRVLAPIQRQGDLALERLDQVRIVLRAT